MEEKEKKKYRPRRSSVSLENDIMEATKALVEEVGFANVTLTGVMQRAGVEPHVFYKRFSDLGSLFEQFTSKYDYWLSEIVSVDAEHVDPRSHFPNLMTDLMKALYRNKGMQRLLVWELAEDNPTTRRTAQLREISTEPLVATYMELFKHTDIDVRAASALLIGGIYYLILHSKRSTFCEIDFSTPKGKEKLEEAIRLLSTAVLGKLESDNPALSIARKLQAKGVDAQTIEECTGVKL